MPQAEPDDLLRKLAEIDEERAGDVPADEALRAFAAGRLAPDAEVELAAVIADSPAARERLAVLAGVELPQPRAATRRKVLAALAGENAARKRHSLPWSWGWGLAAAAVLAAALAWPLLDRSRGVRLLQDEYRLQAQGQLGSRSAQPGDAGQDFVPAGRGDEVTIRVLRDGNADLDPRITLYLRKRDRLEKIREIPAGPKATILKDLAEDLVGETAGRERHLLLVVISQPEDPLPETVRIEAGQDPAAALAAGKTRRVLPLSLVPP